MRNGPESLSERPHVAKSFAWHFDIRRLALPFDQPPLGEAMGTFQSFAGWGSAILLCLAVPALATTIHFEDQAAGPGPVDPNPYTYASGLTITFSGFARNSEAYAGFDATIESDDPDPNHNALWSTIASPTITFSQAVTVSSFWVWNLDMPQASNFTVTATGPDDFSAVFTAQLSDQNEEGLFWEVSSSESFPIGDFPILQLQFSNFKGVLFDELTFDESFASPNSPEPSAIGVLGVGGWILARRQGRRRAQPGSRASPNTTAGPYSL